jgi:hypothetical protein
VGLHGRKDRKAAAGVGSLGSGWEEH